MLVALEQKLNLHQLIEKIGHAKVKQWLDSLSEHESYLLDSDPYFSLREKQIMPDDDIRYFVYLILSGRGFGKAVCNSMNVLGKYEGKIGWKKHGDLRPGDQIFDEKGQPCKVTGFYPQPNIKTYRLKFSDGTSIEVCADHLWTVWGHKDRKQYLRQGKDRAFPPRDWASFRESSSKSEWGAQTLTTQQLIDNFTHSSRKDRNWCIPVCEPVNLPDKDLPLDPYLLGLWIGDGGRNSAVLCTSRDDIHMYCKALLDNNIEIGSIRQQKGKNAWTISGLRLAKKFKTLAPNKTIPEDYLYGSKEQRLSFLQGLMDSDGYAEKSKVEFCSMTKEHAEAVVWLARSLGQKPVLTTGKARLNGKDYGVKYRVHWKPNSKETIPFRLSRKAKALQFDTSQQSRNQHRMITDWEYLGEREGYSCISVDSPNKLYLVGEALIPTHNTHCGASWVIKRAYEGYGPISLVGQTAADVRDVMVEGNPSSIMELSPDYFRPHYEPSKRRLTWPNGVTATTFAGDEPDQLRGPQSATLWADELAKWSKAQESWDNAIMGLRISDNPRALITTTPRPIEIIKKIYKSDTTYVVTGSTYENKSLSGQFLKAIQDKYEGTTLGRQELHGEIIWEDERALWKRDLIEKYRSRLPGEPINYVIGVDPSTVGKKGNDETGISICCGQILNNEIHGYILRDESLPGPPKVWSNKVKELLDEYPTATIVAESNQGGEMVRETLLQAGIPRVKIQLVHHLKSKYDRAQPISLISEQGFIHWCGTFEKLEDEMCSWTGDPSEKSPNRLDAVVIALTKILITKTSKWQADDMGV